MYICSHVFTTLSPIFSSPLPVVVSKDRLFAVSQLETVRSFSRPSLSLSREESSSFYELAAISGTNDSSWVEIYSYRYRIGVTRGVARLPVAHRETGATFDSRVERSPVPRHDN